MLKARNVALDPTLGFFESVFTDRPGEVPVGNADVFMRLPAQVRRGMLAGGLPVPEGMDARYRRSFATMLKLVGSAYRAGTPLGAARIMRRDRDLGTVAPGRLADLVTVDGDPLRNISDIRRAETTIKGGVVYRSDELYRALGVAPR